MKAVASRLDRGHAKEVLSQVESIAASSEGRPARDAIAKALNGIPSYSWVGVYMVEGSDLKLDAWSGPAATEHTTIPIGKGVCGFAAKAGKTEIVSDVGKDPRYLECFLSTRSEIVVPIIRDGVVLGEIDVDGDQFDAFSTLDREFLEAVASKMAARCM